MNTTETNKKLAEFLGWEQFGNVGLYSTTFNNDKGSLKWLTKDMKFHKDWNWLMLVWEAIPYQTENYCFSPSFDMAEIVVYDKDGDQRITTIYCDKPFNSFIEMVYNLCSMFVDWYNNQKP